MATPFKLKSGNASSFKNLGSSPAKQRVSDLPKNFNTTGSSTSTTPKYKPTWPKGFNTKGSSNTGKLAKSLVDAARALKVKTQNFRNEANKIKTVSSTTNKGSKVVNAKAQPKTNVGPSDKYGQKSTRGRAKFIAQSGGRKVGAPKGVATPKTSTRPANTKVGPSDKYGQKMKAGREKFIEQSGGRKVTKGGGHYSSKKVLDAAKKQGKKGIIKSGARVIGKMASRLIPGLGWGLLAHDVGSWVYKNRKDVKKRLGDMKNPSDHGRPKY